MPSKIIFHSSWYLMFACVVFAALVSFLLYYKNKKANEVSKKMLLSLFFLRFASTFLISILFLNILFQQNKNVTEKPLILFAIDNSSSILSGDDSLFIKHFVSDDIQNLQKDIQEKYQTKIIAFGNETKSILKPLDFSDKETDFDNLFNEIENNYANQNIGAMVLLSDGIYNKGANPINNISKIKYPIYSIAIGDTNQHKDLFIQKIEHNEVAYLGNNFVVEVTIGSKKIENQTITLSLLQNNQLIQTKPLFISKNNFLTTITFTLNANQKGIQQYSAQLSLLSDEKNTANNSRDFVIDVIDNKEKIALISSSPHPDIAAIKASIESKSNYSLECFEMLTPTKETLKSYALVIIEGYNSSQFKLINECKNTGVPFWIINPEATDNLPGVKLNVSTARFSETECYTDETFSLFNTSNELKKFILDAPALKTYFGNYTAINSSNTLIKQKIGQIETENPILIFSEFNGCKCATFIGDGLWKWRLRNFADKGNHELFNELISKTIQYLSVKKDKSFFRIRMPNKLQENEVLEIEAELYNQSYELINDPDVSFQITDKEKHEFNYTFSKKGQSYYLNAGSLKPGEYTYKSSVTANQTLLVKQGKFIVKEVVLEKINLLANHELMAKISSKTNGKLFYPKQLNLLKDEILKNENIKSITYSEIQESFFIDLKWLLIVIVLLLSAEWLIRKRFLII